MELSRRKEARLTADDGHPSVPAYEEVAQALRHRIVSGGLADGDRLPAEAEMAREFGVSRATIREALRVLAAQDLIRTSKGAHGGSVVTVPRVDRIAEFLSSSINLLAASEHITLEELLEARAMLEVPAARLAARRREGGAGRLQAGIPGAAQRLSAREQFEVNRDFHARVIAACGNRLVALAAQPIYTTLMQRVDRSSFSVRFQRSIISQHRAIAAAIAAGDDEQAGQLMAAHLDHLAPAYEKAWKVR